MLCAYLLVFWGCVSVLPIIGRPFLSEKSRAREKIANLRIHSHMEFGCTCSLCNVKDEQNIFKEVGYINHDFQKYGH